MSPNPAVGAPVRPAAVVNEDIRRLARAAWGRPFTDVERARYQQLRDEWVAATQEGARAAA